MRLLCTTLLAPFALGSFVLLADGCVGDTPASTSDASTVDANGSVRRFSGQLSLVMSEAGIDKKLVAPETPVLAGKNDIALLDAANDRVVVFRRDGSFDRQYRHPDFKAMSAFTMRNGVAYVFSGGKLRRVTF